MLRSHLTNPILTRKSLSRMLPREIGMTLPGDQNRSRNDTAQDCLRWGLLIFAGATLEVYVDLRVPHHWHQQRNELVGWSSLCGALLIGLIYFTELMRSKRGG